VEQPCMRLMIKNRPTTKRSISPSIPCPEAVLYRHHPSGSAVLNGPTNSMGFGGRIVISQSEN
jgi:hypothetical protein